MHPRKRILCISNDAALLATRRMLLEQAGFDVIPAFGFAEAMEICNKVSAFDLILMGQTIPPKDKRALIATLRDMGCNAPILSIRLGDEPVSDIDFSIESQAGPVALIEAVKAAAGIPKAASSAPSIPAKSRSQAPKGSSSH